MLGNVLGLVWMFCTAVCSGCANTGVAVPLSGFAAAISRAAESGELESTSGISLILSFAIAA